LTLNGADRFNRCESRVSRRVIDCVRSTIRPKHYSLGIATQGSDADGKRPLSAEVIPRYRALLANWHLRDPVLDLAWPAVGASTDLKDEQ
jgi:hypothetical protein